MGSPRIKPKKNNLRRVESFEGQKIEKKSGYILTKVLKQVPEQFAPRKNIMPRSRIELPGFSPAVQQSKPRTQREDDAPGLTTNYDRDRSPLPDERNSMVIIGDVDANNIISHIQQDHGYGSFRAPPRYESFGQPPSS
jgi:hypothetical protein